MRRRTSEAVGVAASNSAVVLTSNVTRRDLRPQQRIVRLILAKIKDGASIADICDLVKQLAVDDPEEIGNIVVSANWLGYSHFSELLEIATSSLVDANHEDIALRLVSSWANSEFQGKMTNAVFEVVSNRVALDSLPNALDWLKALPVSDGRNFAIATVVTSWAKTDPLGAMGWAMNLAASDGRTDAMQRVFNGWSTADTLSAVEWLSAHTTDPATGPTRRRLGFGVRRSSESPIQALQ